jgi:obg-like ATPase 1
VDILHVDGAVDPVRDLITIHEELRLKDEEMLSKLFDQKGKEVSRLGVNGDKAKKVKTKPLSFKKNINASKTIIPCTIGRVCLYI